MPCEVSNFIFLSGIGPSIDPQLEERALGIASRLASQHFITLADLCNRRMKGSGGWIFDDEEYNRWLLGSTKTLYCVGPREFRYHGGDESTALTGNVQMHSRRGQDLPIVSGNI